MVDVARTEADLTAAWFTGALQQSGLLKRGAVTGVHLQSVGVGQMGRVVRATLVIEGSDEPSLGFIVKMAATDAASLQMCIALGIYEPEVRFYQEIAPKIDMRVPACHFAAFDPATSMFTLVMEDVGSFTRPGDSLAGGSVAQAALAIDALAGLHAPLWNPRQLQARAWLDHQRTVQLFGSLPAGRKLFLGRFGAGLSAEQNVLINRVLPNAERWARQWANPSAHPTVIVHGDYRLDNMLFGNRNDAPPVIVIDWQTLRLGPPMLDAAYYLGASLSTEDRRANERSLIREYHQRLLAAGVEGFDFNACWDNYRRYSLYGLLMVVGISAGIQQTERGDAMLLEIVRRYADLAIDLEAAEFVY